MESSNVRAALGLAAVLAAAGCTDPRTEIIVVVDTDFDVPAELSTIRVEATGPDEELRESTMSIEDAAALPAYLGLVHEEGPLGPIAVRVEGLLAGEEITRRRARISFVSGQTLVLSMHLPRSCEGVSCPPDETCTESGCALVDVPAHELLPWTGEPPRLHDGGDGDGDADADADADADSGCSSAADCDDGISCTTDRCDGDGSCSHVPDDSLCTDGASCDPASGCSGVFFVSSRCGDSCGEGTDASPFATIEEALDAAEAREAPSVVRVATGDYDEGSFDYGNDSAPVQIIGGPGVRWRTTDDVALKVSGGARVILRELRMEAAKTVVECKGPSSCTLEEVTLAGASDYGLKARDDAVAALDRCLLVGNGKAGVRGEGEATITMVNCLAVGNGGSNEGGAISIRTDTVSFTAVNCTFADNDGGDSPGAIRNEGGATLSLSNMLLWANGDPWDAQCEGCTLGPDSLAGDEEPLFVTAAARSAPEDYMIRASSPARDRGASSPEAPGIDYWGEVRDDGSVDSGAHEHRP